MELPQGQTGSVGISVASTEQVEVGFYLDWYKLDVWIKYIIYIGVYINKYIYNFFFYREFYYYNMTS